MPALIESDGHNVTLYHYQPNLGAAYTFTSLMGLATILLIAFMIKYRAWFFIPMVIGGTCEAFGYYGRSWSASQPKNIDPYIMQVLLLMGAPPFISATLYMALTRVVTAVHHERKLKWVTNIYVMIDIIAFLSQIAGSGLQATNDSKIIEIGERVVLGGLIFQLVALVIFLIISMRLRSIIKREVGHQLQRAKISWRRYFRLIYVASVAIWVRSLVRAIEFAQPSDGFINSHESFIYVFDGVPILIVLLGFLIINPGRLVSWVSQSLKDTN
ncbi:uncharacterized protein PV09_09095 [Verruconis gallopava]|uniref:RTA1-domain-containing protein n=1 Tax=Verruconis gallopava TaxID=253628 RepID=A0A0D1YER6_9PEZI|nr:uncharacterized protein PV09_09095 [Verruconis gallopava]KIV99231.1 hypothetical protein PV09_09095 [Verruconis gallopava]